MIYLLILSWILVLVFAMQTICFMDMDIQIIDLLNERIDKDISEGERELICKITNIIAKRK